MNTQFWCRASQLRHCSQCMYMRNKHLCSLPLPCLPAESRQVSGTQGLQSVPKTAISPLSVGLWDRFRQNPKRGMAKQFVPSCFSVAVSHSSSCQRFLLALSGPQGAATLLCLAWWKRLPREPHSPAMFHSPLVQFVPCGMQDRQTELGEKEDYLLSKLIEKSPQNHLLRLLVSSKMKPIVDTCEAGTGGSDTATYRPFLPLWTSSCSNHLHPHKPFCQAWFLPSRSHWVFTAGASLALCLWFVTVSPLLSADSEENPMEIPPGPQCFLF